MERHAVRDGWRPAAPSRELGPRLTGACRWATIPAAALRPRAVRGGLSSIGRASDCGSEGYGFKPRRPPHVCARTGPCVSQGQDRWHWRSAAGRWEDLAGMGSDKATVRREPRWSGVLTRPLGRLIPAASQREALAAIKGLHTALFFSIAAALVLTLWDGARGRQSRRTAVAGGIVAAETAIYLSNNQVCPLTPLAEQLGAERGSVVDMFLPAAAARWIPLVAGSGALLAMALNIRGRSLRQVPVAVWMLTGPRRACRSRRDRRFSLWHPVLRPIRSARRSRSWRSGDC